VRNFHRERCRLAALAITVTASITPAAAAEYWSAAKPVTEELLDEAVVQGRRLLDLRVAMVEAEDRFYARYNALNQRDEFDIECLVYKGTDTQFTERNCFTRAWVQAVREDAFAQLEAIGRATEVDKDMPGETAARPRSLPANLKLTAMFPEYKDNMLTLLRKHPELGRMAREREQLQARYEAERRKRMKGKAVRLE
jgi:hypothetical protein